MTITVEQLNREFAEEIIVVPSGEEGTVFILDTAGEVAQEVDKDAARALAIRLLQLAETMPAPLRILPREGDRSERDAGRQLRRQRAVDEFIRELER